MSLVREIGASSIDGNAYNSSSSFGMNIAMVENPYNVIVIHIRAIYDDPAEIQNNILLKYRKPVHWKVDTVNWILENNSDELRIYGMGAQILSEIGVKKMILLTNTEWKFIGLDAFDIEIIETKFLNEVNV